MQTTTSDAIQFLLSNAKSYNGIIDCKVVYDNAMECWMLDCGEVSLMLPTQDIALEVIQQLPLL